PHPPSFPTRRSSDLEEVLLGLFHTLGDCGGHLFGLAGADADSPVAVAHDHQGGEAEAPTALDDLGDTVDGHHALKELVLVLVAPPAATLAAAAATSAALTGPCALILAVVLLLTGGRRLLGSLSRGALGGLSHKI